MKFRNKKHGKIPITIAKIQKSLIFGAIFGLVMLMIGLSQLFAQSTVAFYLNPYYQSANANEDRSLSISLSNNGQQVDGGSVKITYNPAQLSYVAFNDPVSTQIGISNRVSSPGSYSYDFQIYYGSQNLPSLGTLVLKAKSLSSQQSVFVDFDTSVTKAYFMSGGNRSYYPTAHGRAAIVINAAPPSQPPSQPPAQPPANTTTPPATNQPKAPTAPTTQNPPANSNPGSSTTPSVRGPGEDPGTSGQNYDPASTNSQAEGYVPPPKPKRMAPIIFILIGVVCLAAAGGAYIYLKYIRDLPIAVGIGRSLHVNLFDRVPEDTSEESVVISPAAGTVSKQEPEPEPKSAVKAPPAVIKKSRIRALRHRVAEFRKKKPAASHETETSQPAHQGHTRAEDHLSEHPTAHNTPHKPVHHHQESETVTVSLHPHPVTSAALPRHSPAPLSPAPASVPPKPVAVPQPIAPPAPARQEPINISPPSAPPPIMPAPSIVRPATETKPVSDPGHHIPDWQAQLKVRSPEPANYDDLPDMFELAHDHPESFGSSQLYEEETKDKENYDKTQKQ